MSRLYFFLSILIWDIAYAAPKQDVILVLDAFSSGKRYLKLIREEAAKVGRKIKVIHIQTMERVPGLFRDAVTMKMSQAEIDRELYSGFDEHLLYSQKERLNKIAERFNILRVVSGTETSIEEVDYLENIFGLANRNPIQTSKARRDKFEQQLLLSRISDLERNFLIDGTPMYLAQREFALVRNDRELLAFSESIPGLGLVFKPTRGAGSNNLGIFPAKNLAGWKTIESKFDQVMSERDIFDQKIDQLIVERHVQGTEFQINGFVSNGQTYITSLARYNKNEGVPDYDQWLPYNGKVQSALRHIVKLFVEKTGIVNGNIHIEVIQEAGSWRFHIVEGAHRPAGSQIPAIEEIVFGTDSMREYIRSIVDPVGFRTKPTKPFELTSEVNKIAVRYFGNNGILGSLEPLEQLYQLPGIVKAIPHYQQNDLIKQSSSLTDLLAIVWVVGPHTVVESTRSLIRAAESKIKCGEIKIVLDPPPKAIDI